MLLLRMHSVRIFMEGYKSFTQALDKASDTCSLWKNVDSGIEYTYPELMLVAGFIDREGTLEDPYWYVVFPDGEIAFMCVYNEEIIAMYHPLNQTGIQNKFTGEEFFPPSMRTPEMEEAMEKMMEEPSPQKPVERKIRYCGYCGKAITDNAKFCGYCGKKVD